MSARDLASVDVVDYSARLTRVLVIDRVLERADELHGTDPLEMKILREPQVQQHVKHKVEECFILYDRPPPATP